MLTHNNNSISGLAGRVGTSCYLPPPEPRWQQSAVHDSPGSDLHSTQAQSRSHAGAPDGYHTDNMSLLGVFHLFPIHSQSRDQPGEQG